MFYPPTHSIKDTLEESVDKTAEYLKDWARISEAHFGVSRVQKKRHAYSAPTPRPVPEPPKVQKEIMSFLATKIVYISHPQICNNIVLDPANAQKAGAAQFGVVEFGSSGDLNATSANSGIGVIAPNKVSSLECTIGLMSCVTLESGQRDGILFEQIANEIETIFNIPFERNRKNFSLTFKNEHAMVCLNKLIGSKINHPLHSLYVVAISHFLRASQN